MAVIFVAYKTVDGAISLGRQQNYSPEQPIAFSHALHAGINQIDCKYCHIGVERGKQATIPSVNICMNCHKAIQQGPTGDTTQIAKIYRAAGYNRLLQTYDNSKAKPIEWIRIHNLPDHCFILIMSSMLKLGSYNAKLVTGRYRKWIRLSSLLLYPWAGVWIAIEIIKYNLIKANIIKRIIKIITSNF